MAKVTGRCWPHDLPFTAINGVDGKPYVRDGFVLEEKAGDFAFKDAVGKGTKEAAKVERMEYRCPRTGEYCGSIRVGADQKPGGSPTWKWDCNFAVPTLTPSINCQGRCGWHGYLRSGVFEDC